MELIVDVLIDSIMDTAKLLPFLFVTYLAMEALEHASGKRVEKAIENAGAAGPVVGALLGALPQCGFSAMAATLFSGRVITIGTLVAVLLSTSDEMLPVLIAHGEPLPRLLAILGVKVVVGLVAGIVLDVVLRALGRAGDGHPRIHELCERAHCHCYDDGHDHDHGHDHGHAHGSGLASIARSALIHTAQVSAFIFAVTFVFGLLIEGVGEEAIAGFLTSNPVLAPALAALVGLIPNCAASVAITELFLSGTLATGPMLAGLLANGGVGLLVLFRTNANLRENVTITVGIYLISVAVGIIAMAAGLVL